MIRKITNGGRKVIGKFPSQKMGRMVMWESQIERDYIYLLEFDPEVISFEEQSVCVRYHDDRDGKIHRYTPDFLVTRVGNRVQVVEVKDDKTAKSDDCRQLFQRVAPIIYREGYEFMVVTDSMIRAQPLLDNVKLLQKYSMIPISDSHLLSLNDILSNRENMPFGEIVGLMGLRGILKQDVFALLRHGILSMDLRKEINNTAIVSCLLNSRKCGEEMI